MHNLIKLYVLLVLFAFGLGFGALAYAGPQSSLLDLKHGAQLYSNWPLVKGRTPKGIHPLYPDTAAQTGVNTWLCSECHGWDYMGKEGHYAFGLHSTGIKGVMDAQSMSQDEIISILRGGLDGHDFSRYLTRKDSVALAKFIKEGLFDNRRAVDTDRRGMGSFLKGKIMYSTECEKCHGANGEGHDFKESVEGTQGMRKYCEQSPERTLHTIRWGHPKTDMPSGVADNHLMESATIDILTYCQQLGK